jgi:hypothetical protein
MPKNLPELNEKLIAEVLKHIRGENFTRYHQNTVGSFIKDWDKERIRDEFGRGKRSAIPSCYTKACFGGWGVLLSTTKSQWLDLFLKDGEMKTGQLKKARDLFGFTEEEAGSVFNYVDGTTTPEQDYKIILKRLDRVRSRRKLNERYENLKKLKQVSELTLQDIEKELTSIACQLI